MTLMYFLFNELFLLTFWIPINVDNLEQVHFLIFFFTKIPAYVVISFGICTCIFLSFEEEFLMFSDQYPSMIRELFEKQYKN